MRGSIYGVMALVAVCALPGFGQTPRSEIDKSDGNSSCKTVPSHPPYTAIFKITDVRTLGNGATITREGTKVEAREPLIKVLIEHAFPRGLKPNIDFAGFMYGLKPVPFKIST